MKKIILFICLLISLGLSSQEMKETKDVRPYEIGINLTNILSSFLAVDNEVLDIDPYTLTFKVAKSQNVLRTAASIYFKNSLSNSSLINGQRSLNDNIFGLKLGYERRISLSKRFTGYIGMDFLGEYRSEKSLFVPDFGEQVEDIQVIKTIGAGPVMGVMFHLNSRISLSTETTLYFLYGIENSETKFLPSGEIFSKDDDTFIGLNHVLPQSLYFIFHF